MTGKTSRYAVDLAVDGYIHARPGVVCRALTETTFWQAVDPELALRCYHDRGEEGMRWYVSLPGTGMTGTAEVWLEPFRDGTLPHLFLRCDQKPAGWRARRRARRLVRRAERRLRAALFVTKDRLEVRSGPSATPSSGARDRA